MSKPGPTGPKACPITVSLRVWDSRLAAQLCWEKALALDPNSAPLNALLGFIHCLDARFGWKDTFETAKGKARRYAERALELDPGNADAHITSGMVLLMEGLHDEAVVEGRQAIRHCRSS